MSVIKIKKTENFVILHKGGLEDPRLSFKAKGLWAYCISKPNDWTFNVKHLETVSRDGHDAIYSAINELIEFGYVKRVQEHIKGRFQNVDYEVYEIPEIQIILPQPEKQEAVFQDTENPQLLRIEEELSIDKNKIVCPKPPVGASGPSKSIKKFGTDGKEERFEKDELYRKAVQKNKDWTAKEIEEAWYILCEYEGRVNDIFSFLEGTILNLRKKKNLEKLHQTQIKETKCQNHQYGQKGRVPTKEEIAMLTRPSPERDSLMNAVKEFRIG